MGRDCSEMRKLAPRRKNMPAGNTALAAGDTIYVVGERENLRTLRLSLGLEESAEAGDEE